MIRNTECMMYMDNYGFRRNLNLLFKAVFFAKHDGSRKNEYMKKLFLWCAIPWFYLLNGDLIAVLFPSLSWSSFLDYAGWCSYFNECYSIVEMVLSV